MLFTFNMSLIQTKLPINSICRFYYVGFSYCCFLWQKGVCKQFLRTEMEGSVILHHRELCTGQIWRVILIMIMSRIDRYQGSWSCHHNRSTRVCLVKKKFLIYFKRFSDFFATVWFWNFLCVMFLGVVTLLALTTLVILTNLIKIHIVEDSYTLIKMHSLECAQSASVQYE